MIVVWTPSDMPRRQLEQYVHCWSRFAKGYADQVILLDPVRSNYDEQWAAIEHRPGRCTLWVHPSFIPFPSFFDELDYLYTADQYIIALHRYEAIFNRGADKPYSWEPEAGVSRAFVGFQLNGGKNRRIGPTHQRDVWACLDKTKNSNLYRVPCRYSGNKKRGAAMRCTLGEVIFDPFGETSSVCVGRVAMGGDKWLSRERQYTLWRDMMEAWELWL